MPIRKIFEKNKKKFRNLQKKYGIFGYRSVTGDLRRPKTAQVIKN